MTGGSEARSALLESWRALREQDQLGTLLPRSTNRSFGSPGDESGFVTADYRIYRDVALPAGPDDGTLTADILEMYWSVRTRRGVQDPHWAASVNAHVIQVVDCAAGVDDLERLHRLVVTLRRALQLGGIGRLTAEGKPVALHARGLLLGSTLTEPAGIVEALASRADVPLTVARFERNPDSGFRFSSSGNESRFYQEAGDEERLRALGERFLRHDRLFKSEGVWGPHPDSLSDHWLPDDDPD